MSKCCTEEEVVEAAKEADGLLNQYAPIPRAVIERLDQCKVISRYGIGVDTVDLEAATEKGIIVCNVSDYCVDEVADHAMALMLSFARKVTLLDRSVRSGVWNYKLGIPIYRLRGRKLGLAGFGKIPQNVALKAQAFGLRVIAYDPYVSTETADRFGVKLVTLDELFQTADIVSVHLPLNHATRGMISHRQFERMKPEAFIVNTARGAVIDETALIQALQSNHIAGAALNVLEKEPMADDHPFRTMDNVIVQPHVAWYSEESQAELKTKAARNIADVLSGFYPAYIANPDVKKKVKLRER